MTFRLSIAAAMLLVLISALSFAAIRSADETWSSLTLSFTLLVLGVSVLGSLFSIGPPRAFAAGASVFGLGYLFLSLGPWASSEIGPHLATTRLLAYGHSHLAPTTGQSFTVTYNLLNATSTASLTLAPLPAPASPPIPPPPAISTPAPAPSSVGPPPIASFVPALTAAPASTRFVLATAATPPAELMRVGHSLFALVSALLGGLIARHFHARSLRTTILPPPESADRRLPDPPSDLAGVESLPVSLR